MEKKDLKTAIVLLVEGVEEIETVTIVDVLRRAGIAVTVAGVWDTKYVRCSRDVRIASDAVLSDAMEENYDIVILPGGIIASKAFTSSVDIEKLLQTQDKRKKLIAAICAAPTALKTHRVGIGKRITSYPSFKDVLCHDYDYQDDKNVVVDDNLITSRGPGTAFDFSLTIVEILLGYQEAANVAEKLLYQYKSYINAT